MKPAADMTDEELMREYDAAQYFANASDDQEEIERACARIVEIETEQDRRPELGKGDSQ